MSAQINPLLQGPGEQSLVESLRAYVAFAVEEYAADDRRRQGRLLFLRFVSRQSARPNEAVRGDSLEGLHRGLQCRFAHVRAEESLAVHLADSPTRFEAIEQLQQVIELFPRTQVERNATQRLKMLQSYQPDSTPSR